MTLLEEDHWKFTPGFSWTLPMSLFPFADFVLCPFAVINRNHEYSQLILVNCSGYALKVITNTELASTEPLLLRKIYTSVYTYLT